MVLRLTGSLATKAERLTPLRRRGEDSSLIPNSHYSLILPILLVLFSVVACGDTELTREQTAFRDYMIKMQGGNSLGLLDQGDILRDEINESVDDWLKDRTNSANMVLWLTGSLATKAERLTPLRRRGEDSSLIPNSHYSLILPILLVLFSVVACGDTELTREQTAFRDYMIKMQGGNSLGLLDQGDILRDEINESVDDWLKDQSRTCCCP